MGKELRKVLVGTGLVDDDQLRELQRWKLPAAMNLTPPRQAPLPLQALEREVDREGRSLDITRTTEFDIGFIFEKTKTSAVLVLVENMQAEPVRADVTVGRHRTGEIILPWSDEDDISDILTNGLTFLLIPPLRMFFRDVRDIYLDERKAFLACMPSMVENVSLPGGGHGPSGG